MSQRVRPLRGLSLVEVLFTVVLISISLMTLIQGISQGLQALAASEKMALAATLARQKMTELEIYNFQIGARTSGVFEHHKDFRWKVEIGDPDLSDAKDFAISQVDLYILWDENNRERKIRVTTYAAKIQKLQE